jgi:hypothetical protein
MQRLAVKAAVSEVTDLGEFEAIAATYDIDRVKDQIVFGAFAKTIAAWRASGKRLPSIRSWRLLGLVLLAGGGQRLVSRPVLNAPLELVHRRRCCPTGMPNDPYDLPNASALTAIGRRPAGGGQALGVSTAALADHVCDSWHRRQIRLFPETVDPSSKGKGRSPVSHRLQHRERDLNPSTARR